MNDFQEPKTRKFSEKNHRKNFNQFWITLNGISRFLLTSPILLYVLARTKFHDPAMKHPFFEKTLLAPEKSKDKPQKFINIKIKLKTSHWIFVDRLPTYVYSHVTEVIMYKKLYSFIVSFWIILLPDLHDRFPNPFFLFEKQNLVKNFPSASPFPQNNNIRWEKTNWKKFCFCNLKGK